MEQYIESIGDYRFRRISKALKMMNIITVTYTQGGSVLNLHDGFSQYKEHDIHNLVKDVANGVYDGSFELLSE
jgi:hypothetical protein